MSPFWKKDTHILNVTAKELMTTTPACVSFWVFRANILQAAAFWDML
jgi:hypothetical protein